jgi:hypothetical protein
MLAVLNSVREESEEADDLSCEPFVITPRASRSGWVLVTRVAGSGSVSGLDPDSNGSVDPDPADSA